MTPEAVMFVVGFVMGAGSALIGVVIGAYLASTWR